MHQARHELAEYSPAAEHELPQIQSTPKLSFNTLSSGNQKRSDWASTVYMKASGTKDNVMYEQTRWCVIDGPGAKGAEIFSNKFICLSRKMRQCDRLLNRYSIGWRMCKQYSCCNIRSEL